MPGGYDFLFMKHSSLFIFLGAAEERKAHVSRWRETNQPFTKPSYLMVQNDRHKTGWWFQPL